MATFELVTINGHKAIRCTVCGKTSYNKNDIKHLYCGFCHQFHTDVSAGQQALIDAYDDLPDAAFFAICEEADWDFT